MCDVDRFLSTRDRLVAMTCAQQFRVLKNFELRIGSRQGGRDSIFSQKRDLAREVDLWRHFTHETRDEFEMKQSEVSDLLRRHLETSAFDVAKFRRRKIGGSKGRLRRGFVRDEQNCDDETCCDQIEERLRA